VSMSHWTSRHTWAMLVPLTHCWWCRAARASSAASTHLTSLSDQEQRSASEREQLRLSRQRQTPLWRHQLTSCWNVTTACRLMQSTAHPSLCYVISFSRGPEVVCDADSMFKTEAPSRIQGDRTCRDVFFLIVFAAFWVGMLAVAGIGFSKVRASFSHPPTALDGCYVYRHSIGGAACAVRSGAALTSNRPSEISAAARAGHRQTCRTRSRRNVLHRTATRGACHCTQGLDAADSAGG
jgi:hypothetical protein